MAEGLAETRSRAQALIRAGRVLVDDVPVDKPGTRVAAAGAAAPARRRCAASSRAAARSWRGPWRTSASIPPVASASTSVPPPGASRDCLLQSGARHVVAVDVGYGQLDPRLREDPRVTVLERTNARHLEPQALPAGIELVTVDVSFISLRLLLAAPAGGGARRRSAAAREAAVRGRQGAGRQGRRGAGGALRAGAVAGVREAALALGYAALGEAESRLPGPKGNREIFLWLRPRMAEAVGESERRR